MSKLPPLPPLAPETGTYFSPVDPEQHDLGNQGYDVPDYCRHCGAGFMAHINGRCPGQGR